MAITMATTITITMVITTTITMAITITITPQSTLASSLSSHPANLPARTVGTACSPSHREPPVHHFDQVGAAEDFDEHLAGDAVGPLAEGALEDVHVVLDHRPTSAVWRLKPVKTINFYSKVFSSSRLFVFTC